MNGTEHLKQTLDYYRQQLQKKMDELAPLQLMIRQLERELGESSSVPDFSEALSGSGAVFQPSFSPFTSDRSTDIRPDEFFGMSHGEAAKAYLAKIGHAVSMDELVAALKKGGAQLSGATPKKSLYVSLMRNPLREFVSPSENHIGLRSFYPGLPKTEKAAKSNKAKKSKPRGKSRPLKKAGMSHKTTDSPAKTTASKDAGLEQDKGKVIPMALQALMKDGKARTQESIMKELEQKLGHPVAKIAVFGTLKSKQYQKLSTGEYSLVAIQ
jgi:hypothetical protein